MVTSQYFVCLRPEFVAKAGGNPLDALLLAALDFRCKTERSLSLKDLQSSLMGCWHRDAIIGAIARLERAGHLVVYRSNGYASRYAIASGTSRENPHPTSRENQPGASENPTTPVGKPDGPQSGNPTAYKEINKNFKEHTQKTPPLPPQPAAEPPAPPAPAAEAAPDEPPKKPKPTDEPEGFAEFWQLYPKKVHKIEAIAKYRTKCKSQKLRELALSGLRRELPEFREREEKYIPDAARWLNAQNWLDPNDNAGVTPQATPAVVENKRVRLRTSEDVDREFEQLGLRGFADEMGVSL